MFLAGSTQEPEERLAALAYLAARDQHPGLRLVIVPRHVERSAEIAALLDGLSLRWSFRSQLADAAPPPRDHALLVDTTGELGWWWGTATIAFVGGSLDGKRGGQNMLEPSAYGAAVAFGPHTSSWPTALSSRRSWPGASTTRMGRPRWAARPRTSSPPSGAPSRPRPG